MKRKKNSQFKLFTEFILEITQFYKGLIFVYILHFKGNKTDAEKYKWALTN